MGETLAPILYDLHDPAVIADPYPTYARMRQQQSVWQNPASGSWVVTRYADVQRVLLASETSNHRVDELLARVPKSAGLCVEPLREVLTPRLLFTEGEQHIRLKRLIMQTFAPHHIQIYANVVAERLRLLLDTLPLGEPVDFLAKVTNLLPGMVILSILGISVEDEDRMKGWTDDIYAWIGHSSGSIVDRTKRALCAVSGLQARLLELIAEARRRPQADMLSALVHAEEEGLILSDEELLANVIGLVNAGQETTTCLLANGLIRLLQFPEQQERLRENPSLIESGVEEMLRFDAPAQFIARRVEQPLEMEGIRLEPGALIALGLASANRDKQAFDRPNEFDVGRSPNPHLSFGHGIHFCVGNALARMEAKQMFVALLERFRSIHLACSASALPWRPTTSFRCPVSLPIVLQS
jgi:cytochrome P450